MSKIYNFPDKRFRNQANQDQTKAETGDDDSIR